MALKRTWGELSPKIKFREVVVEVKAKAMGITIGGNYVPWSRGS